MAKHERQLAAHAAHLVNYLDSGIQNSGLSVELVDISVQKIGDTRVWLYVYDKYYMRNSSRTSLTLQVIGRDGEAFVSAIGAGGGNGNFLNFDYGSSDNFVSVVEKLLDEYQTDEEE